ncbi:MAG: tRNA epoxyqueuosine(34) reductase QueG, partial [Desulfitobacterium hafniense]|nr:tRNA epoxyqueuosine(34) reductase QueG [Desulfitobacterium hafniense]
MGKIEAQNWKDLIKVYAAELGFVAVGITGADPVYELERVLEQRVLGKHATPFEDRDIRRRIDPKEICPLCKSIIALAYPLPLSAPANNGQGQLARSAVGEDYHKVLRNKCGELVDKLKQTGWMMKSNPIIQVDNGPLNERAFALRAGLGFIGRNHQLIVPGYGSFVALGLILLDQALPPDQPLEKDCGNCTRCLEVCPAQLLGEEEFKANRCLSYLTQSKETLADADLKLFGKRIFGCDSCQDVCPFNYSRIRLEQEAGLNRGVNLRELLNLSKSDFNHKFKHTAAGWRGKTILQRNAAIAAYNTGEPSLEQCGI